MEFQSSYFLNDDFTSMQPLFLKALLMIVLLSEGPGGSDNSPAKPAPAVNAGSHPGYVILVPSGESENGFPVLRLMDPDDLRQKILDTLFHRTFISEMVSVNQLVSQFLLKKGLISRPEPVYLLISGRQGGFPMKGFYLSGTGGRTDKTDVPYVELAKADSRYRALSSATQIYPHELAHILYMQIARTDLSAAESFSTDMHYFSLVTDYLKAFNEGYAESFENLSRDYETNTGVIRGIRQTVERYERILPPRIRGFDRDFRWPARVGFYRLSMVIWYQQMENYKRYAWAANGYARYLPADYSSLNPEKAILYRSACVIPDSASLRTAAQSASTEGVISSFFTKLRESPAPLHYADRDLYLPFISDTAAFVSPRLELIPVKNQLLKEFYVIHKYLSGLAPGSSPFFAFINGYISEFPEEGATVLGIFREVTGRAFPLQTPPELWVVNREHHHNTWLMAQFGGTAIPFYTFNLNTAGWMDLATLRGVSRDDGRRIVAFRDSSGYFKDFSDLFKIKGLRPGIADRIVASKQDSSVPRSTGSGNINMLTGLLKGVVERMLLAAFFLSALTSLVLYLLFRRDNRGWKRLVGLWIRTFFKALLFLVAGLTPFVLQLNPFIVFLPFTALLLAIGYFRTRNRPGARTMVLVSTGMIALILCYSLI